MSHDLEKMIDQAIGEGLDLAARLAETMSAGDEMKDKSGPAALLMFAEAVRIERARRTCQVVARPN